jgi:uncharacterized protein YciI
MQFVWIGFLNSADPIDPAVQAQITDFLGQPYIPISAAGALWNEAGERSGYLVVFEAEDRAAAEALVQTSPVREAGLYRDYHLFDFHNQIG